MKRKFDSEKINKSDEALTKLTKKKKYSNQKWKKRPHYWGYEKQKSLLWTIVYIKKIGWPTKVDKSLDIYNSSGLTHEEIENLNWVKPARKIKSVIKNLLTIKAGGKTTSLVNSIKHIEKNKG